MKKTLSSSRKRTESGDVIIEFALVIGFLMPVMFGVFSIGMSLTMSVRAASLAKDAGVLFMRYVDFSNTSNQDVILKIANGFIIRETGGNGVLILTQIMKAGTAQCVPPYATTASCPNFNEPVIVKRIVLGNPLLTTSRFGTPSPALLSSDGSIIAANYLADLTARATGFNSVLNLNDGEFAFVSEVYVRTPELDMPGIQTNSFVYQRSIQ